MKRISRILLKRMRFISLFREILRLRREMISNVEV